jgi:hypothetical protein
MQRTWKPGIDPFVSIPESNGSVPGFLFLFFLVLPHESARLLFHFQKCSIIHRRMQITSGYDDYTEKCTRSG